MSLKYKWNLQFILDLLDTPRCLIPLTTGGVIALSGWAISTGFVMWGGLVVAGIGLALGITRLIGDHEALMTKFLDRERKEKIAQEEVRLQSLAEQLNNFPSKEIRNCLRSLRALKKSFEEAIEQQDIATFVDADFQYKFTSLFWKSTDMIERAMRLQKTAASMSNKESIFSARDKVIDEVGENVITLTQSFEGLTVLALTRDEGALDNLRRDLGSKLSVASEIENELNGGGTSVIDGSMKEYL